MTKTCPNNLFKTYLVSYPRSGHHLMQRGLDAALGHKLVYSEFYNCVHNFETCEYVNLQKSHDFDMELEIREDMKYIVMWRFQPDADKSWFIAGNNEELPPFVKDRNADVDYADKFWNKWGLSTHKNLIFFNYDYFIKNKLPSIIKAATFMGCTDPDYTNIGEWLKREERFK